MYSLKAVGAVLTVLIWTWLEEEEGKLGFQPGERN